MNAKIIASSPPENTFRVAPRSTLVAPRSHVPLPTPATSLLVDQIQSQRPSPDNPRRNGKVARLPKQTRDLINHMLDDGLPYRVIIDELGEAGAGLNAQNLTNWHQGGYQGYLKHQDLVDQARAQLEFATRLLHETAEFDPAAIPRALNLIATTQMMNAITHYGEEALTAMMQANPLSYLTLLNTLCRITDTTLKLREFKPNQAISSPT